MPLTFSKAGPDTNIVALTAAALGFAAVLFLPAVLNDGDTYWHIMAGRWMLENGDVLRIDPFSYSFAGHPWHTHEWLAEVAMALAYIGGGWQGIVLLFGAAAALTAGLLARHLSRWLGGLGLIATLVLSLACVAGSLLARPHLLALPVLEMWTAGLLLARGRTPPWKLLPLMVLWANLHASFLIGLGLAAIFAVEAVLDDKQTRAATLRHWSLFFLVALVASMLTPYGASGLIFPFKLMAMPSLQQIGEWAPTDFRVVQPLTVAGAVALYVLLTRGAVVRPLRMIVLLGLIYLALAHVRHHMLLAVAGPLILAGPLANALGNHPHTDGKRGGIAAMAVFCAILAALTVVRLVLPLDRGDGKTTPATALAQVPVELRRTPVFNDYAFGGYLIFNRVRPYIDSRAELYGEAFLSHYGRMIHPDPKLLNDTLIRRHVRWTILAANNPAVEAMDHMNGWRRLYADRWAVVHVRNAP